MDQKPSIADIHNMNQQHKLQTLLREAKNVVLSTHRQCDGDGLGAELALRHSLLAAGKKAQVIQVDSAPKKYRFLEPEKWLQNFEYDQQLPEQIDLFLILDTNDERLLSPLFSELQKRSKHTAFIDHHPVLKKGPKPTAESWIDLTAASTGEMAYRLIQGANLPINREVARCLYTSITFDTQLYRFVRNSAVSHRIAAEMIDYGIDTESIHRHLFGHHTIQKVSYLAKALGQIEYSADGQIAFLRLHQKDLLEYQLEPDDSRDIIDMLMNIESIEAAVLFREEQTDQHKISFRSKGKIQVLSVAESLGGGGHLHAAGVMHQGDYRSCKKDIEQQLAAELNLVHHK